MEVLRAGLAIWRWPRQQHGRGRPAFVVVETNGTWARRRQSAFKAESRRRGTAHRTHPQSGLPSGGATVPLAQAELLTERTATTGRPLADGESSGGLADFSARWDCIRS